jgi:hypothetical protein
MRARWNVSVVALAVCRAAWADGCYIPTEAQWKLSRERSLVNEPSQKAMVMVQNGVETLVISPGFTGNAADFAWVVPVPKRPQVATVKGALFHELARLIRPEPASLAQGPDGRAAGMRGAPKAAVTVLERKPVGAYDVSVLAATDSGALMRWLKQNRYHLPPAARKPIAQYIHEGWTFVACRVRVPKDARGLATGTLAPLKFTFPSRRIVYPMRLSSANPKPFDVLVYVVTNSFRPPVVVKAPRYSYRRQVLPTGLSKAQSAAYKRQFAAEEQQDGYAYMLIPAREVESTKDSSPTVVGLVRDKQFCISAWGSPAVDPRACTRDFVWTQG